MRLPVKPLAPKMMILMLRNEMVMGVNVVNSV